MIKQITLICIKHTLMHIDRKKYDFVILAKADSQYLLLFKVTRFLPAHTAVRNKNSVIPECLYRESSNFVAPNVAGSATQASGDSRFFLLFFKLHLLTKSVLRVKINNLRRFLKNIPDSSVPVQE